MKRKNAHLHTLMKGSEKHKQFCFSTALIIYTIITYAFLLGKVGFQFELQILQGTKKQTIFFKHVYLERQILEHCRLREIYGAQIDVQIHLSASCSRTLLETSVQNIKTMILPLLLLLYFLLCT